MTRTHRLPSILIACLALTASSACDEGEDCPDPAGDDGRVEVDTNLDGVVDLVVIRDGNRTTIEHDLDGDGVPEIKTFTEDSNGDGKIDISRTTVCAKGKPLIEESLVDLDNDGMWDVSTLKIDTDGDGMLDYEEHRRDSNGDGVPDELFDPLGG